MKYQVACNLMLSGIMELDPVTGEFTWVRKLEDINTVMVAGTENMQGLPSEEASAKAAALAIMNLVKAFAERSGFTIETLDVLGHMPLPREGMQ